MSKLAPVYYTALQGDIPKALKLLKKIPAETLTKKEQNVREKLFARFVTRNERFTLAEKDRLIRDIVKIYRLYWQKVLSDRLNEKDGEAFLFDELARYLSEKKYLKKAAAMPDQIEKKLKEIFKTKNYHCILGKVLPFRELELWKIEEAKVFSIKLPETTQRIKVVFMDGFITHGWEEYATAGRYFPGGWAKKDAIYCVKSSYRDLSHEKFRISYLTHEAQHFSDYKKFPGLVQYQLEYRAKLAELSYADKTLFKLISNFISNSKNDPNLPHSFANYNLIKDLSKKLFNEAFVSETDRWKKLLKAVVNCEAKTLLITDSVKFAKK